MGYFIFHGLSYAPQHGVRYSDAGIRAVGAAWTELGVNIGQVLKAHLPSDDPLHAYGERLNDPALRSALRGYLTGSIDLAFRLTAAGRPRYGIVDY